jgi:hypothetical protein
VKSSQRLAYGTLAEALGQRGLVEPQRLTLALQTSVQGPIPFPEVLVGDGLIGDWELSKTVCDLYGLPFLPIDICGPQGEARQGLDTEFLIQHRLVPLSRFGNLLVVAMPGIVPAEVLAALESAHGVQVLAVVGTVNSNNRWLQESLAGEVAPALPGSDTDWSNIFDEGDAAVLLELTPGSPEGDLGTEGLGLLAEEEPAPPPPPPPPAQTPPLRMRPGPGRSAG